MRDVPEWFTVFVRPEISRYVDDQKFKAQHDVAAELTGAYLKAGAQISRGRGEVEAIFQRFLKMVQKTWGGSAP